MFFSLVGLPDSVDEQIGGVQLLARSTNHNFSVNIGHFAPPHGKMVVEIMIKIPPLPSYNYVSSPLSLYLNDSTDVLLGGTDR